MRHQIIRKIGMMISGIVFSISLVCGYSNQVLAKENQKYSGAIHVENPRMQNAGAHSDEKSDNGYETIYSDTVSIDEKDTSVKVLLNPKDCKDGTIQIDGQDITINSQLAEDVGYAHANVEAYDFTGDGKEEIALIISGGASGSFQAVQIFGNAKGVWTEINVPSEVYKQLPRFVVQQQKKLGIIMDASMNYYRTVSIKEQKLFFTYQILSESGAKTVGTICQELVYSSDKNAFVLGDTKVTSNKCNVTNNKCSVKTFANKKSITVKWSTEAKKSSVKGVQIKIATKKSMKNAKTYKFGKTTARKMSYKFTVKSGKISKTKTYYVKVRLKVGNKWTKWSDVKNAKTEKK